MSQEDGAVPCQRTLTGGAIHGPKTQNPGADSPNSRRMKVRLIAFKLTRRLGHRGHAESQVAELVRGAVFEAGGRLQVEFAAEPRAPAEAPEERITASFHCKRHTKHPLP